MSRPHECLFLKIIGIFIFSISIPFLFGIETSMGAVYNPDAAANYARNYCNKVVSDGYFLNSSYPYDNDYYGSGNQLPSYVGDGNDCAHFVSNVIGTHLDDTNEPGGGLNISSDVYDNLNIYGQVNVLDLVNRIIDLGYGTSKENGIEIDSLNQLKNGDIVAFDWNCKHYKANDGKYDHIAFYLGNSIFAQHSPSECGKNYNINPDPTKRIHCYRFIHIFSNGDAQTNCAASISSSFVVHIPLLTYSGYKFWVDLQYNSKDKTLSLMNYGFINDVSPYSNCTASSLTSGLKLHIPALLLGNDLYWLDLQYGSSGFVITGGGTVNTSTAPTATLSASPNPVAYNGRSTLTWSSTNATSCTAGGPWSNSGTLSGSGLTDPLTAATTFTFQCTGSGGTSHLQSVTVTVTSTFTVTPSAVGTGGSISPSLPQTVSQGSTTSFTITPDAGYSIASVTGCGGTLSGSTYTTGAITANCTVTVSFSSNHVNGACGSSNGEYFATAPSGNLCSTGTASAVSGSGPWTWTCNGANGGTNTSCSADVQSFIVSTSAGSGGSISPSSATVKSDNTTSFTVTANTGYSIASVTGCGGTLSGNTYTTGTITANCTVTASFTQQVTSSKYTDNGNGTVTDKITGLMWQQGENSLSGTYFNWYQASGTYDAMYNPSSQNICGSLSLAGVSWRLPTKDELLGIVDISYMPPHPTIDTNFFPHAYNNGRYWSSTTDANYTNYAWDVGFYNGGFGSTNESWSRYVRCVHGAVTQNTYTVMPSASPGGSISPSVWQTVASGSTITFTVTPDSGYTASVDGTCGGNLSGSTYTTYAINKSCTVVAMFSLKPPTYTVTPSVGAGGSISPSTPQTVTQGGTITFTVTPNTGYTPLVGGTCGGNLSGSTYTTYGINENCTVVANFTQQATSSKYTDNGNGTVTDSTTGLIWQQGENSKLETSFNWYQASGTYDATYNPSSQSVCGSLSLAGGGWRLPSLVELQSILDNSVYPVGTPGLHMDTNYFPMAYAGMYWAITQGAYSIPTGTWLVLFNFGYAHGFAPNSTGYVRCVR